jgi:hypothetical protein
MEEAQIIATGVTAALGVFIALAFKFFPGLKSWYGKLNGDAKGGLQLGLITLIVLAEFGLSALEVVNIFPVTWDGVWLAVIVWVLALAGNQGTYLTTNKIGAPKES